MTRIKANRAVEDAFASQHPGTGHEPSRKARI